MFQLAVLNTSNVFCVGVPQQNLGAQQVVSTQSASRRHAVSTWPGPKVTAAAGQSSTSEGNPARPNTMPACWRASVLACWRVGVSPQTTGKKAGGNNHKAGRNDKGSSVVKGAQQTAMLGWSKPSGAQLLVWMTTSQPVAKEVTCTAASRRCSGSRRCRRLWGFVSRTSGSPSVSCC